MTSELSSSTEDHLLDGGEGVLLIFPMSRALKDNSADRLDYCCTFDGALDLESGSIDSSLAKENLP